VIHPGVTLAEGCVVGSYSLVTKSTDPWAIYFGIAARPIKIREKAKMIAAAKLDFRVQT
jgi:galactoside O-acetyltransferase